VKEEKVPSVQAEKVSYCEGGEGFLCAGGEVFSCAGGGEVFSCAGGEGFSCEGGEGFSCFFSPHCVAGFALVSFCSDLEAGCEDALLSVWSVAFFFFEAGRGSIFELVYVWFNSVYSCWICVSCCSRSFIFLA
jgi:hypothetical protein